MNVRSSLCTSILALLAIAASAAADAPAVSESQPWWISEFFRSVPDEAPDDLMSGTGQRYMQLLPAVGREDMHSARNDWPIRPKRCESSPEDREPLAAIVAFARDTRIVIVNEAHDRPRHREFIREVAIALRPLGYTSFAAETFRDSVADAREQNLPLINDGFYSNEPVFGRLMRDILAVGYRLEAYEYRGMVSDSELPDAWARADRREEAQANNLARIVGSLGDQERILIHVGYSHAAEVPIRGFGGRDLAWMAARLNEKTGIDALTIDQTSCESGQGATILTVAGERHVEGQFDLVVGHPPLAFERSRPRWRLRESSYVDVPAEMRNDSKRIIIEARPEGEPSNTVPVDRLMLWPGEALPLLLRKGRYTLTAWTESRGESESVTLQVD